MTAHPNKEKLAYDKKKLRHKYRLLRQQLPPNTQKLHAQKLAAQLNKLKGFIQATHVGIYQASDGEISCDAITQHSSKRFYLPKVLFHPKRSLVFTLRQGRKPITKNRYGIPEMSRPTLRPIRQLDCILMPLVAFDETGHRLGMGGGFYDRSLLFKAGKHSSKKPLLIGLAHECQKASALPKEPWDIGLDWLVTEKQIYHFSYRP
ncbi:MAG: 5-formyltetrahydrofolate cyclo-ligase [Cellvibrionales bacterium]|nr:5-formyltetrahydrofolate cyclo-ligase [Cellvibrionales bacterium]